MNEIEKLYENAGVETNKYKLCCTGCKHIAKVEVINGYPLKWICDKYDEVANCDKAEPDYPPFTAEKQLKLIEFMLKKYGEETIGFELWKDNSYHAMCHLGYDGFENYADSNTLCGAIAGLITLYWQSLTEEERKQIKEILE